MTMPLSFLKQNRADRIRINHLNAKSSKKKLTEDEVCERRILSLRIKSRHIAGCKESGMSAWEWLFVLLEAATEWNKYMRRKGIYRDGE